MKKTRFTEEQMVTILREADERPVPDIAKKHCVSAQTIYAWRKHFGSLEPTDVKRLRQLEHENQRLKKMVADRDLELDVLKEITRNNGRRTRAPQQVAYAGGRMAGSRAADVQALNPEESSAHCREALAAVSSGTRRSRRSRDRGFKRTWRT